MEARMVNQVECDARDCHANPDLVGRGGFHWCAQHDPDKGAR